MDFLDMFNRVKETLMNIISLTKMLARQIHELRNRIDTLETKIDDQTEMLKEIHREYDI